MSKLEDYMLGKLDTSDPWVSYGLEQGWLKARSRDKKKLWGDQTRDTRTFQQYDPSNAPAQRQIGSSPAGVVLPNNPYREQAKEAVLKNVAQAMTDPMMGTFAGETALANLVKAKAPQAEKLTADFAKAKELHAAGVPDREIHAQTGWTKGFADKQWRFEIPDNEASVLPPVANSPLQLRHQLAEKIYGKRFSELTKDQHRELSELAKTFKLSGSRELQDVFQHPELYAATGLGNTPTYLHLGLEGEHGAYGAGKLKVGAKDAPSAKSPMLHEIQHGVQEQEGFARGGSVQNGGAETYRRLAGEAEARLTQNRMNLTAQERGQRYPVDEFDVPVEQQIVRGVPDRIQKMYSKMTNPKEKALLEKSYPGLKGD